MIKIATAAEKQQCSWCKKKTKQLVDEPGCTGDCAYLICMECYEKQADAKLFFRSMMSEMMENIEQDYEVIEWVKKHSKAEKGLNE